MSTNPITSDRRRQRDQGCRPEPTDDRIEESDPHGEIMRALWAKALDEVRRQRPEALS